MSVNKYLPHVLVLPEDRANSQMANGFLLGLDQSVFTRIQVLEEAGGWIAVLERFESDHIREMDRFGERFMVLLIDFDGDAERLTYAKNRIPPRLAERVFILGALSEPEELRSAGLGNYGAIGSSMAQDCRNGTHTTWEHDLVRHNASELNRLRQYVRPILFG